MSESENKKVVLKFFENLSMGDIDAALALMDNDAVYWIPGKPKQFPLAGTYTKHQFVAMLAQWDVLCPTG
jgi:ketosteroid isomerase-like protein